MMPAEHLDHLTDGVRACTASLSDRTARVAHCPGWDVAALVRHLGGVHRWATDQVRGDPPADGEAPSPLEWGLLTSWFAAGARELVDALRTAGPDRACPTLDGVPGRTAFWFRRQALETAVHRWDVELAHGEPGGIDPALAADGIAEVADVLLPRQLRLGRVARGFAAVLLVPDGDPIARRTLLSAASSGCAPVATVTGAVDRLFLLLWHRIALDGPGLSVTGDRAAAERTLALPLTP